MSNSDGGLDGDGVAEEKHVGTPFVQPVICPPKKNDNCGKPRCRQTSHLRGAQNPLVITLKSKSKVSTAACVDMKGIQVGVREELDKLYFLRNKTLFKVRYCPWNFKKKKKVDRPFVMTLNGNHSLLHSNQTIWRGNRRVHEEVRVDQGVLGHLWREGVLRTRGRNEMCANCNKLTITQCLVPQSISPTMIAYSSPEDAVALQ